MIMSPFQMVLPHRVCHVLRYVTWRSQQVLLQAWKVIGEAKGFLSWLQSTTSPLPATKSYTLVSQWFSATLLSFFFFHGERKANVSVQFFARRGMLHRLQLLDALWCFCSSLVVLLAYLTPSKFKFTPWWTYKRITKAVWIPDHCSIRGQLQSLNHDVFSYCLIWKSWLVIKTEVLHQKYSKT